MSRYQQVDQKKKIRLINEIMHVLGFETNKELANYLRLTPQQITRWRKGMYSDTSYYLLEIILMLKMVYGRREEKYE